MSGLIMVLLTIYFASRKDKEQWLFDRKRLTILALMFVIVGISWGLNDKIMILEVIYCLIIRSPY